MTASEMDDRIFDEAYKMGVKHMIERLQSRLYYVPDAWRKSGEGRIIYDTVMNTMIDFAVDLGLKEVLHNGEQTANRP